MPAIRRRNSSARSQEKHYRPLPAEYQWGIQNRYVGDWLIYGSQYTRSGDAATYAVPYAAGGQAVPLALKFCELVASTCTL